MSLTFTEVLDCIEEMLNAPQSKSISVSPESYFEIISAIFVEAKHVSSTFTMIHLGLSCDFDSCIQCKTQMALSSLSNVLESKSSCNVLNHEPDKMQKQTEWCDSVLNLIKDKKTILDLVPICKAKCALVTYSARKLIVLGLSQDLCLLAEFLSEVDEVGYAEDVINIMLDIMSQENKSHKNKTELAHWVVKNIPTSVEDRREKLPFEKYQQLLLKLWQLVLKFSSSESENISNFNFIQLLSENSLIWKITKENNGHIICTQYIKTISTLLKTKCKDIDIVQAAFGFLKQTAKTIEVWRQNNMLEITDFVGCKLKDNDHSLSSSILKPFTLTTLQATLIILEGEPTGIHTSKVIRLLCNVITSLKKTTGYDLQGSWITTTFGDEDDKLIDALNYSLQIYKNLKRYHQTKDEGQTSLLEEDDIRESEDSNRCSLTDFVNIDIDPNILFLQFSTYIDFDHLVLSDFLSSPETLFLVYFNSYLHNLEEKWSDFAALCNRKDELSSDTKSKCFEEQSPCKKVCLEKPNKRSLDDDVSETILSSKKFKSANSLVTYNSDSDMSSSSDESNDEAVLKALQDTCDVKERYLDKIMTMLIKLRYHIERLHYNDLFPFHILPILKQLKSCEKLFDGIDD